MAIETTLADVLARILDKPSMATTLVLVLVVVYAVPLLTFTWNVDRLIANMDNALHKYCNTLREERLNRDN